MKVNKEEIRQIIAQEIASTEAVIRELQAEAKPVSPENAIGRISRMDAINNKSVIEASIRQNEAKLAKLKMASSNIDKAGFGICTGCGKPIPVGRIMLMPHATRCVQCA